MQQSIAFLVLVGLAQASNVLKTQENQDMSLEDDGLSIKMPEAIVPEKMPAKEAPKVSLSLVQSESQLGMFESGILSASLRPIVKAKVRKAMTHVRHTKEEYQHGTVDQRKAIQDKAHAMIMNGVGTREYNFELCNELWSEASELASALTFYYCPELIFPTYEIDGFPDLDDVVSMGASRMKSAYLTFYLWTTVLDQASEVKYYLADDVVYSWGYDGLLSGKSNVEKSFPFIGFPDGSYLSSPVEWHCDMTGCIAPLAAWSAQKNYVYSKFNGAGLATELIVPLGLWR